MGGYEHEVCHRADPGERQPEDQCDPGRELVREGTEPPAVASQQVGEPEDRDSAHGEKDGSREQCAHMAETGIRLPTPSGASGGSTRPPPPSPEVA